VSIDWPAFLTVTVAAIVAASLLVTLFAVGLRLSDGAAPWRRPVAVVLFVLCGLLVAVGVWLVVPALHPGL
jgi:hypothetical protein